MSKTPNFDYGYGSHLPPLIECVMRTTGPVLEIGSGKYSTPVLHQLCRDHRMLVTVETNPAWYTEARDDLHGEVRNAAHPDRPHAHLLVPELSQIPDVPRWSVVLVDCAPADLRVPLVRQYANQADFIVCHDWPYDPYPYPLHEFRHAMPYTGLYPWTLVLSNERRASC